MIEWNKVHYCDCMDKDIGLPSLPDKSVDLCLTDPPWLVNYNGHSKRDYKKDYLKDIRNPKYLYGDNLDPTWNLNWFNEIMRICNGVIICVGRKNLKWWYRNTDPIDIYILISTNLTSQTKISRWNRLCPYLFYGEFFKKHKLHSNSMQTYNRSGFLADFNYIHPSPKEVRVWKMFIKELCPKSVIDPFLGSGTAAEVCTKLGIPWLGYEINEIYSKDINRRLKNCKREPKQTTLELLTHK